MGCDGARLGSNRSHSAGFAPVFARQVHSQLGKKADGQRFAGNIAD
jgi:hypothetical protein